MKNAKISDNSFMKKMVFLVFLIFLLIFIQIFSSNSNRIVTFHPKMERDMIGWIGESYQILDGNRDEVVGSAPKAIYKVYLPQGIRYLLFGREKSTQRDFILLIDPFSRFIENRLQVSPYFFKSYNTEDYRGLLDLNNDRNLEVVCVVNGKVGKRIKIYKITSLGLIDLSFPFLEGYAQIEVNDFNIDGTTDIACFQKVNGITQSPHMFKLVGPDVVAQKLSLFPSLVNKQEDYLASLSKHTEKSGNKVISWDILLSKAQMVAILGKEKEFDDLLVQMDPNGETEDITKKMRIYKMKVLQAYFFFNKGEDSKADQQLKEAISYMYRSYEEGTKEKSTFHVEKTIYHLQYYQWKEAKLEIEKALLLDPNNAIAEQIYLEMGNS